MTLRDLFRRIVGLCTSAPAATPWDQDVPPHPVLSGAVAYAVATAGTPRSRTRGLDRRAHPRSYAEG